MELYNRLINEGVFVFWNDDAKNDKYVLKIYFVQEGKNIELFSEIIPGNRHCFSADKLGSGNYIVELHAYKGDKLTETVEKKVNLTSTIQKLAELKDAVEETKNAIEEVKSAVYCINFDTTSIDDILNILKYPQSELNQYNWADFLERVDRARRNDW